MTAPPKRRRASRGAIIRRLRAYAALRLTVPPQELGRIDWLLWGHAENPWLRDSVAGGAYVRGFNDERRRNPNPAGTRLNPKKENPWSNQTSENDATPTTRD
jgi:hypothetical protein